ncbi:hypothetical protein KEM52_001582 [Ascosphaera acerosa]|nr:hypothetical protein KEM52_001582 [Ascosphaera acerosa]
MARHGKKKKGGGHHAHAGPRPQLAHKKAFASSRRFELRATTAKSASLLRPEPAESHWSLSQEARNTERHHAFMTSGKQLRHSPVRFVSGGTLAQENYQRTRTLEAATPSSRPARTEGTCTVAVTTETKVTGEKEDRKTGTHPITRTDAAYATTTAIPAWTV